MKSFRFRYDVKEMKLDTLDVRGVAQTRRLIKPQPIVAELKEHNCKYIAGEHYKIDDYGVVTVTSVRCERLQSITYDDCLMEGILWSNEWETVDYKPPELLHPEDLSNEEADREIERGWIEYTRQAYAKLWDSLYPENKWDSNPWVWVIEFKPENSNEGN